MNHPGYLAIDVGGTKTLLAIFNHRGEIIHRQKITTNHKYAKFLTEIQEVLGQPPFSEHRFAVACCAVPGKVDRQKGIGLTFGNLPWENTAIKKDLEKMLVHATVYVENDANLAGLYEASLVKDKYRRVLYLTISTGIGDGIIINGRIDPDFANSEAGQMVMQYEGELVKWEEAASGQALFKRYGKKAAEIDDQSIWKEYVKPLAAGIGELVAVVNPEVIILGGGVGAHYDKFTQPLLAELQNYESKMVTIPPILKAKNAEEAVIYGCYEFIKQH